MTREHYDQLLLDLNDSVERLGTMVVESIGTAVDAIEHMDANKAQDLIAADSQIDAQRYEIENQAVALIATQQPMAGDLRAIVSVMSIAGELERIGDYSEGIAKLTLRMAAEPLAVEAGDLCHMARITQGLLRDALTAFTSRDMELAGRVWARDDEIDQLYGQIYRKMLLEMAMNRGSIRTGTYFLWAAHNVERMADRVTNIAEYVAFAVNGDIEGFRDHLRSQAVPA